jgi:ElaB/YqjD/DUF883 family membrane-anchored ribosome-binding protein
MSNAHSANPDELVADAKVVLDDVEATGERAQALRARASEALSRAKTRLHDAQGAVRDNTRKAAHATDAWVHDNPWGAIGIAAGVGFLVGLLVSRR